jgi:phospholipase C
MQLRMFLHTAVKDAGLIAALFSTILNPIAPLPLNAESTKKGTASPIKHVIIIIGENRTFDHVFATYVPKQGETVSNLLSKGIVNGDGTSRPELFAFRTVQRFR